MIVNGDESTIATIVEQLDFEPKKKPIAAIVKASTVEVVMPTSTELFDKVDSSASFEVYDPKIENYEDDSNAIIPKEVRESFSRDEYISMYSSKISRICKIGENNESINVKW